jgi:hypothetical protein
LELKKFPAAINHTVHKRVKLMALNAQQGLLEKVKRVETFSSALSNLFIGNYSSGIKLYMLNKILVFEEGSSHDVAHLIERNLNCKRLAH